MLTIRQRERVLACAISARHICTITHAQTSVRRLDTGEPVWSMLNVSSLLGVTCKFSPDSSTLAVHLPANNQLDVRVAAQNYALRCCLGPTGPLFKFVGSRFLAAVVGNQRTYLVPLAANDTVPLTIDRVAWFDLADCSDGLIRVALPITDLCRATMVLSFRQKQNRQELVPAGRLYLRPARNALFSRNGRSILLHENNVMSVVDLQTAQVKFVCSHVATMPLALTDSASIIMFRDLALQELDLKTGQWTRWTETNCRLSMLMLSSDATAACVVDHEAVRCYDLDYRRKLLSICILSPRLTFMQDQMAWI